MELVFCHFFLYEGIGKMKNIIQNNKLGKFEFCDIGCVDAANHRIIRVVYSFPSLRSVFSLFWSNSSNVI